MLPLVAAHLETLTGIHNSHELVFPSEAGTPIDPKNIRRRHFAPAMKALGIQGVRQHDMRRTFIAVHVEAGTHPKLVQDRVGHSDINLTMNVYAKLAGKMKLGAAEQARFNGLAHDALPANASREATPTDALQSNRRLRLQGRKLMRALNAGEPEENLASKTDAGDFAEDEKEK